MKWEIISIHPGADMPEDWEPFAVTQTDASHARLWLRRRVISVEARPVPRGVLSAKEMAAIARGVREALR